VGGGRFEVLGLHDLPMLAALATMLAQAFNVNIPIWNQYSDLIKWILNHLAEFSHSGGIAIIAFTIIVKTLLLPLTVQSIRSSKAMQELQPKIKELQKKHGKDRQRLTQETMALYQQYHVNPMAGCLPMVIQIPIFLGVYHAINDLSHSGIGHWNDSFLWLPLLDKPDPYHILPILAAIFQFVQSRMMRPAGQGKIADPQQAMMNSMMNLMPLTVILFGWNFASGPVLYWVTQSLYSVVQQWFITGWGAMLDWLPMLPEMPEHRRLGYRPPRNLDDVVVVSGEASPRSRLGVMNWMQQKMQEAQAQSVGRGVDALDAAAEAESPRSAAKANGSGGKGRAGAPRKAKADGRAAEPPSEPAAANGSKAVVIPRKARPGADDGKPRG
jgi:YidC/Oxa1 family membrane protein insertase